MRAEGDAIHARDGNERGVALCLWAGADPHRPVPDLRYAHGGDEEDEDESIGSSAVETTCRYGNTDVLERLGPDPELDDFDELYQAASSGAVVEYLAAIALPRDADDVITHRLWWGNVRSQLRPLGNSEHLVWCLESTVSTEGDAASGWQGASPQE